MKNNLRLVMFHIEEAAKEEQILALCVRLGFSAKRLSQADINTSVGELAGLEMDKRVRGTQQEVKAPLVCRLPEVMIFSGLDEDELERFLQAYRKEGILPVGLKAVITPYNVNWSLYHLTEELARERAAMQSGK